MENRIHPRTGTEGNCLLVCGESTMLVSSKVLNISLRGAGFKLTDSLFGDMVEPGKRFTVSMAGDATPLSRLLHGKTVTVMWADSDRCGCRTDEPLAETPEDLERRLAALS